MAYYNVCPDCGSNLDPGEKCECKTRERNTESREYLFGGGGKEHGGGFAPAGRTLSWNGDRAARVG